MAKAADENSTCAGSRSSPPLCGPHWISLWEEVEREWRRLGWSDPAMGEQAIKVVNAALEAGDLFGKLIEGDREESIPLEHWREDLVIHFEADWRWLDDEQGVEVPDLSTLRVKSRREPDRQLLVLVWVPPAEATLSTVDDEPSAKPQSSDRGATGPSPPLSGTKRWVYEFMQRHSDAEAREVWENRPDAAAGITLKTVQNQVSEYRRLPGLSRKSPKSSRKR